MVSSKMKTLPCRLLKEKKFYKKKKKKALFWATGINGIFCVCF